MVQIEIPDLLKSEISRGNVVLILGAGASLDAKTPNGEAAPSTKTLAELLADRFLDGKFKALPLNQVAELAINESSLGAVQGYIAALFEPLLPTPAHLRLAELPWFGLATTNYDLLIERGYEQNERAIQRPVPLIEDTDHVEENFRDPKNILLLKLHGCITRTSSEKCPLILTTDQYLLHRRGRERLFTHLTSWAYDHHLLFVGHSLQDPDLRAVLLTLSELSGFRPRYYTVTPNVQDEQVRLWDQRRVTVIKGTFEELIFSVDTAIATPFRKLVAATEKAIEPVESRIRTPGGGFTKATREFLATDVQFVNSLLSTVTLNPKHFYRGVNSGFSAIEQNLDVRRRLADTVLSDWFLADESQHSENAEFVLIKAHAGAGKTVLLHRIAWDAARDYDRLVLFLKSQGTINIAALREVLTRCVERVYLFVDDAAERAGELRALGEKIGPEGRLLTVVIAERINEYFRRPCLPIYRSRLRTQISDEP